MAQDQNALVWLDMEMTGLNPDSDRIIEIAVEDEDPLTEEEEDLLDENVAVIFFERSDGIVETNWFADKKEADEEWASILVDTDGDEEEDDEDEDEEGEED